MGVTPHSDSSVTMKYIEQYDGSGGEQRIWLPKAQFILVDTAALMFLRILMGRNLNINGLVVRLSGKNKKYVY